MHFMIDMENTGSKGLQGVEYLAAEDCLSIFYSKCCMKIEDEKWQQIMDSNCALDLCRLENTGRNALDYYIASRIGEVYGGGYKESVAIVSNDKGFRAVQDYWKKRVSGRKIILRPSIELCIVAANENSERRRHIQQKLREINMEEEYQKYQLRLRRRKKLLACFVGTEYEAMLDRISQAAEGKNNPRQLYLDMLKTFGRKDGLAIYRQLKNIKLE